MIGITLNLIKLVLSMGLMGFKLEELVDNSNVILGGVAKYLQEQPQAKYRFLFDL